MQIKSPSNFILPLLFVLVFIAGLSLRIHNLNNITTRSLDEEIYARQAKTIINSGYNGIKPMIQRYNSQEKLWIFPPPIRIGYLFLLANTMKLTKKVDMATGAYISFTFSIISLLLLILIGLRFFNPWIALYALIFMSISPLELAIARRTWVDAILSCLSGALIYLCCEITRNSKRIIWYILFILIGTCSLLVKEAAAATYGLFIIWILWILFIKEKAPLKGTLFLVVTGLAAGIYILGLTQAAGGIKPILLVLQHMKEALPTNTYAIEYQTGPWYNFLLGFWITSPISALLFIAGTIGGLLYSKKLLQYSNPPNIGPIYGIIFFSITFLIFLINLPLSQNLRYASPLLTPFYLIAGLGFWYIVSPLKIRLAKFSLYFAYSLIILVLILCAISDYLKFQRIFVKTITADTSINLLKKFL